MLRRSSCFAAIHPALEDMPQTKRKGGRLYLQRTPEERKPLVNRLNRIEGQVRGLRKMIEDDRYCGDELQQLKAIIAALRKLGATLVDQHVSAAVGAAPTALTQDILHVLEEAKRL
jgi:CsoR family transcriptional regulator, copper-sensing transcriptional repressor